MNEEKVRKIIKEENLILKEEFAREISVAKNEFIREVGVAKDEFVREVGVAMEEFSSQMKTVVEYVQGIHEHHEKRLIALEEKVM